MTKAPWWIYAAGFALSLGVGTFFTTVISNALWRGLGWTGAGDDLRPYPQHPNMLGVVERTLYTVSWLVGEPEFVAVWLALKVAGQWSRWSEVVSIGQRKVAGRAIFNVFLLGNAFSIAFGLLGGFFILSVSTATPAAGLWAAGALVLGSLAFWAWASLYKPAT